MRVPWNEPGIIGKVLDGGAWGVICPMVNTKAEAQRLVEYSLYPPAGKRSNGPIRAAMYGEASNYQKIANNEVMVIPMIETQEAIDNIEAILDVPGISGIYVGPSDLGFSMGLTPILDREEPKILGIYEKLIQETKKRGLFAGLHNGTRGVRGEDDRHGLPLRHHRQRQRPDGARGARGGHRGTQGRRACRRIEVVLKPGAGGAILRPFSSECPCPRPQ